MGSVWTFGKENRVFYARKATEMGVESAVGQG